MLFQKKKIADPDSLLQDAWRTDFHWYERKRFANELAEDFSSKTRRGRLELTIHKSSCFAWVLAPHQYRDFMIQAKLQFRRDNNGKVMERLFNTNVYFKAYLEQSLDQHAELARWRRAGVRTSAAPPYESLLDD